MGRIGAIGCAKIIGAEGEPLPAYEHTGAIVANQAYDDQVKIRIPMVASPVKYETKYGGLEKNIHDDISDRLRYTNNKTEYEVKVGKRQEGLIFKSACDKPVVNLLQNYDANLMPLPMGEFTEREQQYLRGDNLPLATPHQTEYDEGTQALQKTQEPFEKNKQPTELQFIDEDGGKYYTSILKRGEVNELGSNVRADQYFDENDGRNQPVGDRSVESLYDQQMGYKTVSNVNIKQQNNFKAKQHLGLYQGTPSTQKEKDDLFLQEFIRQDMDSRHFGGKAPARKRPARN
jgi:hypothetical protein